MSTSDRYTVTHYGAPLDCTAAYASPFTPFDAPLQQPYRPASTGGTGDFLAVKKGAARLSDSEIVADVCRRLLEGSVSVRLREMLRMALERAEEDE